MEDRRIWNYEERDQEENSQRIEQEPTSKWGTVYGKLLLAVKKNNYPSLLGQNRWSDEKNINKVLNIIKNNHLRKIREDLTEDKILISQPMKVK